MSTDQVPADRYGEALAMAFAAKFSRPELMAAMMAQIAELADDATAMARSFKSMTVPALRCIPRGSTGGGRPQS